MVFVEGQMTAQQIASGLRSQIHELEIKIHEFEALKSRVVEADQENIQCQINMLETNITNLKNELNQVEQVGKLVQSENLFPNSDNVTISSVCCFCA